MSKAKVTRKWAASNYTCVSVGYCDLRYLLRFQNPQFYTCGVYGWNCDIYTFGNYAITTGYRGMISHVKKIKNAHVYNDRAREILSNQAIPYEEQKKQINALLVEYLNLQFRCDDMSRYVY